ncbi:MAG: SRPBCC family protein [Alphaproteobacteria bacterium]|nr:SRPBCC family protein [Alphaproteobacteria bacterium]
MADDVRLTPKRAIIVIAAGLAASLVIVGLPYLAPWLYAIATGGADPSASMTAVVGFNASLTLLFPAIQGAGMGVALGRSHYGLGTTALLALAMVVVDVVLAIIVIHEGAICLIIMSPLLFLMIWIGEELARLVVVRIGRKVQVSLIPLVVLAVFAEARGPTPNYMAEVTDSVVVNAPPEYVWRYVTSYPENRAPPEYWLWQAGLPYPTQSIADAPQVGAKRICAFNTGIAFEERITELRPNEVMTFEVTAQPDHPEVTGHFQFDRGQIRLTRNADGTTTLTATSWYRLFVRPAVYFDWWTADITRQVHFRVLNHMRDLAEADYRQAPAL